MVDIKLGKITLEEPYSSLYACGYIVISREPRRNVILYNSQTDRSTVSLARYLYEVSIGEFLPSHLVVDHVDGNQMNDVLTNYQTLTIEENNKKATTQNKLSRQMVEFRCGSCNTIFSKPKNLTHLIIKSKMSTYCSRKCAGMRKADSIVIREYRR